MKTIIFSGGLGNQIFEYAFYLYIRKHVDPEVCYWYRNIGAHNGFELPKWFDVDLRKISGIRLCYLVIRDYLWIKGVWKGYPWCNESDYTDSTSMSYIEGYWQNKKYLIPNFIKFKKLELNTNNRVTLLDIQSSDSVSVHIRRGDYLLPHLQKIYGGICTKEYYERAIKQCQKYFANPKYFVFSDDIDWVKENLFLDNVVFVDWNKGDDSVYDMYLMSRCKFNIIANSTFSFWGAYLNKDSIGVVYPKKWYSSEYEVPDIFPNTWTGI